MSEGVSNDSPVPSPKQGRLISKINKAIETKTPFYSFEFFPPKTTAGVRNLFSRMNRMAQMEPMFMDVTWGAGGSTAQLTLEISSNAQLYCKNSEVMMHLTCTNMSFTDIKNALDKAKQVGIRNILALRGDAAKGSEEWEAGQDGFQHAVDLVRFIRKEYGAYFCVAVAGYPEGHSSCTSLDDDIRFLKEKVEAGADFVVTQLFYNVDIFFKWVDKCRVVGITCPIIPGIMPIQNYNGFKRMSSFCKTHVPRHVLEAIEPLKQDDAKMKDYGIKLAVEMGQELLSRGFYGLHFYTLNLERSVTRILEDLGHVSPPTKGPQGVLPWKQSQASRRRKEDVRPIFWANRPESYLNRTSHWDEFPNGRWGNAESPAFGELDDYHLCTYKTGPVKERIKVWGAPACVKDVYDVFARYIEGKVPRLPWCESSLQLETLPLQRMLSDMNRHGFLTINSQPRVNGVCSSDPAVGWGGPGGFVFQKAYLEFFTSKTNLLRLTTLANSEFQSLSYMASNVSNDRVTNQPPNAVTAVTWGVFPNKEIVQPTVVESSSFDVWKAEAFALWRLQWASCYKAGSDSADTLKEIHDEFYLVNVVDNNFVQGDIFAVFRKIIAQKEAEEKQAAVASKS